VAILTANCARPQIARDGLYSGIVASSMIIVVTRKDTKSPMMTSLNYSTWRKAEKDQNTLETTSGMSFQENVLSWASFSNEAQNLKRTQRVVLPGGSIRPKTVVRKTASRVNE
jgi:hypothetical protein